MIPSIVIIYVCIYNEYVDCLFGWYMVYKKGIRKKIGVIRYMRIFRKWTKWSCTGCNVKNFGWYFWYQWVKDDIKSLLLVY